MSSDSTNSGRKGRRAPIPTADDVDPMSAVESAPAYSSATANEPSTSSHALTPLAKRRRGLLVLLAGGAALAFVWLAWSSNQPTRKLSVERENGESRVAPLRDPQPSIPPTSPPKVPETLSPSPPLNDLRRDAPPARSDYWAADAGLPLEYGNAWAELQTARELSAKNVLAKRKRIGECEERLHEVVEEARDGLRKQARVMVVAVSPEKVTVLADVSAGWLVEGTPVAAGKKTYSKYPTPWNVVWLSTTGKAVAGIELQVGKEIADWRAEGLQWGDVLDVSFDVTDVRELATSSKNDGPAAPAVLVSVADLRCFDRVNGVRPEQLWPDPDSLPRIICESPRYAYDLTPLFAPAPMRVRAKVGVESVNEQEVVLQSHLRSPNYSTIVRLHAGSETIAVPVAIVGEEAAAGLGPFAKLILEFTVKTLTPAGGLGRTINVALDAEIEDVQFISVYKSSTKR